MELYQVNSQIEQRLSIKANMAKIPLGGTLELTPMCNMDCNMCYIKQSVVNIEKLGGILPLEQWLNIAKQLKKMGTLFLLITGGEPLLYPNFKKLFAELHKMGFILQLNTNGTLIDEEMADFFLQYMPRQINITLYGANDETYKNLCHNPNGFSQVTNAIKKLNKRSIPLRITSSLTPDNIQDIEEILGFAKKHELEFSPNEYMFPTVRLYGEKRKFQRFSPEECAKVRIRSRLLMNKQTTMYEQAKLMLRQIENTKPLPDHRKGFQCKAGNSGFWLSWRGELLACGMMDKPAVDLRKSSVEEAWKKIVEECKNIRLCSECINCNKRSICNACIASCYAEASGNHNKRPQYLCDMTDQMIRLAKEAIEIDK